RGDAGRAPPRRHGAAGDQPQHARGRGALRAGRAAVAGAHRRRRLAGRGGQPVRRRRLGERLPGRGRGAAGAAMDPIRIGAVVRRHWLVLWRGPHRWFEISFWPVMDAVLWGSLGIYMSKTGTTTSSGAATTVNLLLAGIVLFWTLTVVQMTMSMSIMD